MCVKFPLENLNPNPYSPHPTNTYTCRVTTASRVRGDIPTIKVDCVEF